MFTRLTHFAACICICMCMNKGVCSHSLLQDSRVCVCGVMLAVVSRRQQVFVCVPMNEVHVPAES